MLKRITLGIGALTLLAAAAFAQTAQPAGNPPPPANAVQNVDDGQQDQGSWWGWGRRHHGEGHGHMGGMMGGAGGPGGMMMDRKGFGIMLGQGRFLHVNCDNEAIKQCIESAQPLIDALNKAAPLDGAAQPQTKTP